MLVNFISEEEERCYGLPMDAIILVFLCNRCQDTLGLLCMLCSVQQGLFLDFIHYCGYAEDIIPDFHRCCDESKFVTVCSAEQQDEHRMNSTRIMRILLK